MPRARFSNVTVLAVRRRVKSQSVPSVNEATLFRHFGNKTALLEAMREWSLEQLGFDAALESLTGEIESDLIQICTSLYERMMRNQAIIRISLAEEETDPDQVPTCLRGTNRNNAAPDELSSNASRSGSDSRKSATACSADYGNDVCTGNEVQATRLG